MNDQEPRRWPGYTEDAYPEVFNTMTAQPKTLKPGQISEEKARQFFDEGYLVIDNFFKEEELNTCKDAINLLVDQLANKLYSAGKVKSLYSEYGYENRLTMLENDFPGANIILHKLGRLPQAFCDVWSNERLLNLAEQLLGSSDIVGHPVWNLRPKTPQNEATTVPWHQDAAYMDNNAYKVFQLTAWIPVMDADAETGCLQMMRYGHKTGRVATHVCCTGGTWYVEVTEDEMRKTLGCNIEKDRVTCPIKYGGLLLFNNVTPHQSLPNLSKKIRWSLDLRWQKASEAVGFYGLKEGVRMRSSTDPNLKIDWESYDTVDRRNPSAADVDEFATTNTGPWMLKWEIINHNKHTSALAADSIAKWSHVIFG